MPIGGFNGSDPSPTLEQFQQYVANGEIHYYIAGGLAGRTAWAVAKRLAASRRGSRRTSPHKRWAGSPFTT